MSALISLFMLYITHRSFADLSLQVQDYLKPFRLPLVKLKEVSARLKKSMARGLGKHSHNKAAVKMLPTFVRATPDGTGEAVSDLVQLMDIWATEAYTVKHQIVESTHLFIIILMQICKFCSFHFDTDIFILASVEKIEQDVTYFALGFTCQATDRLTLLVKAVGAV